VQFYQDEPTARTSWRMAILLGANSRPYKFALGAALAGQARQGREWIDLDELADPYALALAERVGRFSQAPAAQSPNEQDFLTVCREEASASVDASRATARLLEAAVTSIPGMVMQKFHNLRGELTLPHRFYEIEGRGSHRRVRLTADLHAVTAAADDLLDLELAARWSIVESSFSSTLVSSHPRGPASSIVRPTSSAESPVRGSGSRNASSKPKNEAGIDEYQVRSWRAW
jgi:hypothetical protein